MSAGTRWTRNKRARQAGHRCSGTQSMRPLRPLPRHMSWCHGRIPSDPNRRHIMLLPVQAPQGRPSIHPILPNKSCRVCFAENNLDHSQYIKIYQQNVCLRCIDGTRSIINNRVYKTPNAAVLRRIVMRLETLLSYNNRHLINSMVCTPKWETHRQHIDIHLWINIEHNYNRLPIEVRHWINKNVIHDDPRGPKPTNSLNWYYDSNSMCWIPYTYDNPWVWTCPIALNPNLTIEDIKTWIERD